MDETNILLYLLCLLFGLILKKKTFQSEPCNSFTTTSSVGEGICKETCTVRCYTRNIKTELVDKQPMGQPMDFLNYLRCLGNCWNFCVLTRMIQF